MIVKMRTHWLFILLLIAISAFYLAGTAAVPFHPDESTFLYMSSEFKRLITEPLSMSWESSVPITPLMRYRMIDAPLTRYLVGFGLTAAELSFPEVDWDWSASWHENLVAGAIPSFELLLFGRMILASLLPMGLILLYLVALKLDGRLLGISAVIIFSTHPLVLLHTRRVMAEGILVFTIILAVFALLLADRHPFLAGLAIALAFNAKHTAGLLLPVGLLAAGWLSQKTVANFRTIITNLAKFLLGFGLLTLLLNPFLWMQPFSAASSAISQRQGLVDRQVADYENIAPDQVLGSYGLRTAVAIAQVYLAPPVFSEVGNYSEFTRSAEQAYSSTIGSQLGRSPVTAGFMLGLTLLGLGTAIRTSFSGASPSRRNSLILLLGFSALFIGMIILIPLAWQRYYLPLIPFISLFAGLGITRGIKTSRSLLARGRLPVQLSKILAQFTPDSWMP
jgi:4-amino-4-deoxy-L-arabinose transferase-like glycosyltransferase